VEGHPSAIGLASSGLIVSRRPSDNRPAASQRVGARARTLGSRSVLPSGAGPPSGERPGPALPDPPRVLSPPWSASMADASAPGSVRACADERCAADGHRRNHPAIGKIVAAWVAARGEAWLSAIGRRELGTTEPQPRGHRGAGKSHASAQWLEEAFFRTMPVRWCGSPSPTSCRGWA
jgi:hypothetical protein